LAFSSAATAYAATARDHLPPERYPAAALAGVLTYIGRARRAIAGGDVPGAHAALMAAQQVVAVLRGSLDPAPAPELAARLDALYGFMLEQLRLANVGKSVQPLDALTPIVLSLREAWEGAAERVLSGEAR
jgi:flagellar protein FliS